VKKTRNDNIMNFQNIKTGLNYIKSTYKRLFVKVKPFGWFGDYTRWEEANSKCTGYEQNKILGKVKTSILKVKKGKAVYERDSVAFKTLEYSEPLLQSFKEIAASNQNCMKIVDFGGSLGSTYFQYRNLLQGLNVIEWNVVEQSHFVKCGKKYIQENGLRFYNSIEDALSESKANSILLSSVIQYLEKPYDFIEKLIQYGFDFIIVDRTAFIENEKDRITVQIVPEFIYKASYPAWFFNEQSFIKLFKEKYEVTNSFLSEFSKPLTLEDGTPVYWKGFVLKKTA
jgi:putative methyltransferase (TIGR04325 family)